MVQNTKTPDSNEGDMINVEDTAMTVDDEEEEEEEEEEDAARQKGRSAIRPDNIETDEPTDYSLFSNPPNLGAMRERLFKVEDPIQLSPLDFDAYFKFVDNVWRKERSGIQQPDGTTSDMYCCRLRKTASTRANAAKHVPDEQRKRKKVERDTQDCEMTIKVIYSGGAIPSCTVVHGGSIGVKGLKHTHDLAYMDRLKRCVGIMDVARAEGNKGFQASSTFEKMWSEPDKMRDAGGAHMKVSDVRNVQIPWREANRDVPYKVHTGYSGVRNGVGRKPRTSLPASSPASHPKVHTSNVGPTPELSLINHIPPGTLQYPEHARTFLQDFLPDVSKARTRPHVTLTYAQSLDGRISLMPGVQTAISGLETKAMTHYLRSVHDAILIGVRTAIADDPGLNCRLAGAGGFGGPGQERQPRPIIIDPYGRLQIRPDMKILRVVAEGRARAPWVVIKSSTKPSDDGVRTLNSFGGEYLSIRSEPNGREISWENIFKALFAEGIRSIMVEGGGIVLSDLLKPQHAHLLDSAIITIAPTFMGKSGTDVSPPPSVDQHGQPFATRLTHVTWQPMGNEDVVMCGKVKLPSAPQANGILSGLEQFANAAPAQSMPLPTPRPNGKRKERP